MPRSQCQLVNEVEGAAHLLPLQLTAVPILLVRCADVVHMVLHRSKTYFAARCNVIFDLYRNTLMTDMKKGAAMSIHY